LWIADNAGAKFWLSVMTELKNRGVQDVLIAVVDGLKGFPEAITAAFPQAAVQTCIVHPLAGSALPTAMSREARASFPELLRLEGPQGRRGRSARDLRGRNRRSGRCPARCV